MPQPIEPEAMEPDFMTIGSYTLLKKVGSGGFGSVYLCKHVETQQSFAAKLFKMNSIMKPIASDLGWLMVEQEVNVLRKLNHSRTIKYEDIVFSPYGILVIMELVHGRTVFDYMPKEDGFFEPFARRIFKQLLEAVDFLHKNRIVHRDIKLENVMIDGEGNVKLIDYGLAEFFPNDREKQVSCGDSGGDMMVSGLSGTRTYWAPELLKSDGKVHGDKTDIWATGVFLYSLVSGFFPFDHEDDDELFEAIRSAKLSFEDTDFSKELKDLLVMMLEKDPKRRASLSDIMAHPWVKRERFSGSAEPHTSFYWNYPGKRIDCGNRVRQQDGQQARSCNTAFPTTSRKTGDKEDVRLNRSCGGKFVSEFTGKHLELKFPLYEGSTSGSGSSYETGYSDRSDGMKTVLRKKWRKIKRVLGMTKTPPRVVGERERAAMRNFSKNTDEHVAESGGVSDASGGSGNGNKKWYKLYVIFRRLCSKRGGRSREGDSRE